MLTGQGTVFCAGADLSGDAFAADYPDRLIELNKAIDAAPMPVIGAINGPAIGAGLQLAMLCDLRVVAPDAFFQFPTRNTVWPLTTGVSAGCRRWSVTAGPARCC